jgi:hypothetical protein
MRRHLGHSHSRDFAPKADMLAASALIALLNRKFRSVTGAPEELRTPDPQIRSLVLYPAELRARIDSDGCAAG